MALDGIVIHALTDELNNKLINGKVDKIYQPESDEILLTIRNNGTNYKLLLSANSSNPRIYLTTNYKKENPISAPMFCMLLRKHLINGRIVDIYQPEFERVIKIRIESYDELRTLSSKELIIEIMGKHSNIILVHNEDNKIIDSAKRIPLSISSLRQVLPGKTYENPPSQNKLNPLIEISHDEFKLALSSMDMPVFKAIYSAFGGVSPVVAKEICFRANLDENLSILALEDFQFTALREAFSRLFNQVKLNIYFPCMIVNKRIDKIIDFSSLKLTMFNHYSFEENESISFILDRYYYEKDIKERMNQKSQDLRKTISIKLDRLLNKLSKQREELLTSQKADTYKIKGELLTANIYLMQKGMKEIEVINFYDENANTITISLDKNLSPSENAQKYFKRYTKLKHANIEISQQILISNEEIEYLENIILNIENCESLNEIDEIRDELIKEGYLKSKNSVSKSKEKVKAISAPLEFTSINGFSIFVGKNNKQNDYLTLKLANSDDIWLHTKDIPGSHVIVKTNGSEVTSDTLYEAAMLAAYYSKGKLSSKVPVDYTLIKNVKKPNGSKPGMVIYDTNNTLYVTPLEEEIVAMKNR